MSCLRTSSLLSCAILLAIVAGVSMHEHLLKTHPKVIPHKQIATWEEARQRCERGGATLASPISEELLQHMRAIITVNNHSTPYFVGFRARQTTEFRSAEGILLEDVPKATELVERIDRQEGDCLSMDGRGIRVESCWSRLPFMCYTNETSDVPAITYRRERLQCGPDYKLYATGCYKLHEQRKTWASAYWTCAAEGAYLVVINDSDEAKVLVDIIRSPSKYDSWVGLRQVKGSQDWAAITGERTDELYNVWRDAHDANPCAFLWHDDGALDDYACEATSPFVCEK